MDDDDDDDDSPETIEETLMSWKQTHTYPYTTKTVRVVHFSPLLHCLEKETEILNALPPVFNNYVHVVKREQAMLKGSNLTDTLKAFDMEEKKKLRRTLRRYQSRDGRCTADAFRVDDLLLKGDDDKLHLLRLSRTVMSESTMREEAEEFVKFVEGLRPRLQVLHEASIAA